MSKNTKIIIGLILAITLTVFGIYKYSVRHTKLNGAFVAQSTTGGPSNHMIMAQGTTTPCALLSPNATTTLLSLVADMSVSTTTAYKLAWYKSASAFATTTLLAQLNVGANVLMTLNATNTIAAITDNVVAPNTWFVLGMSGGTGTFSPTGACNATYGTVN